MGKKFPYKIEGESFSSEKEKLTAKMIIEYALEKGIPTNNQQVDDLVLKGQKKNLFWKRIGGFIKG